MCMILEAKEQFYVSCIGMQNGKLLDFEESKFYFNPKTLNYYDSIDK